MSMWIFGPGWLLRADPADESGCGGWDAGRAGPRLGCVNAWGESGNAGMDSGIGGFGDGREGASQHDAMANDTYSGIDNSVAAGTSGGYGLGSGGDSSTGLGGRTLHEMVGGYGLHGLTQLGPNTMADSRGNIYNSLYGGIVGKPSYLGGTMTTRTGYNLGPQPGTQVGGTMSWGIPGGISNPAHQNYAGYSGVREAREANARDGFWGSVNRLQGLLDKGDLDPAEYGAYVNSLITGKFADIPAAVRESLGLDSFAKDLPAEGSLLSEIGRNIGLETKDMRTPFEARASLIDRGLVRDDESVSPVGAVRAATPPGIGLGAALQLAGAPFGGLTKALMQGVGGLVMQQAAGPLSVLGFMNDAYKTGRDMTLAGMAPKNDQVGGIGFGPQGGNTLIYV